MTNTPLYKTDIEYLHEAMQIEFPPLHSCGDCDGEYTLAQDAIDDGHIVISNGEWAIAIACEGYHQLRDYL